MIDALVGVGVSNLLLSAGVGLLAYAVHRRERDPALAHLLWVLTLVAAVTPPLLLWSVPILPATVASQASVASATDASIVDVGVAAGSWLAANLASVLLGVWAAGSLAVLVASAQRIVRFGILLRRSCRPAPEGVQRLAAAVAYELDMRTVPSIHVSAARLAPMTWWSGGRARVVLPEALRSEVDEAQLRWILAHELAHIKRHDHLVRWLEWLASVAFWWNPVVWWARRHLRRDEEDACDALVLEHLQGQPRDYARTLLTVVEVMAAPAGNAPALATGLDAARSLEHRFSRIVSPAPSARTPRAIASGSVVVAVLLMTVGVGLDETPPSTAVADTPSTTPGSSSSSLSTPGPAVEAAPRARTAPLAGLEPLGAATTTLQVSADIAEDGTYIGTAGSDVVTGTDADETFKGYGGADTIGGGPGRDIIDAGDGADTVRGGAGADTLNGGHGRDTIGGGAGADTINGGAGADVIQGGAGRDTVSAGPGDDIVRVWADGSPDVVDCGGGNDKAVIGSTDKASRCEVVVVRDPR